MINQVAQIPNSKTRGASTLLVILLSVSILLNILLFVFAVPNAYWAYTHGAPQLFSLDDPLGAYTIRKDQSGEYIIKYNIGKQNESGAGVGSTQVPLDSFVGKKIKVTGNFRPIFGSPTCWKKCQFDAGISDRQIVIDVKDIQLAQ